MKEKTIKVYIFSKSDVEYLILKYLNDNGHKVCASEIKFSRMTDDSIEVEKVEDNG